MPNHNNFSLSTDYALNNFSPPLLYPSSPNFIQLNSNSSLFLHFRETLGATNRTEAPIAKKIETTGQVSKPSAEEDMVKSEECTTTTNVQTTEEPQKTKQVTRYIHSLAGN